MTQVKDKSMQSALTFEDIKNIANAHAQDLQELNLVFYEARVVPPQGRTAAGINFYYDSVYEIEYRNKDVSAVITISSGMMSTTSCWLVRENERFNVLTYSTQLGDKSLHDELNRLSTSDRAVPNIERINKFIATCFVLLKGELRPTIEGRVWKLPYWTPLNWTLDQVRCALVEGMPMLGELNLELESVLTKQRQNIHSNEFMVAFDFTFRGVKADLEIRTNESPLLYSLCVTCTDSGSPNYLKTIHSFNYFRKHRELDVKYRKQGCIERFRDDLQTFNNLLKGPWRGFIEGTNWEEIMWINPRDWC